MDRIINTNKKLRANKISIEEYFKQQNSNIKRIDKVILNKHMITLYRIE
jgi:hypothetical protein